MPSTFFSLLLIAALRGFHCGRSSTIHPLYLESARLNQIVLRRPTCRLEERQAALHVSLLRVIVITESWGNNFVRILRVPEYSLWCEGWLSERNLVRSAQVNSRPAWLRGCPSGNWTSSSLLATTWKPGGREEVNRLLDAGWRLLHIYTLKYEEDGLWRERPMGILGRLRNAQQQNPTGVPALNQSPDL